MVSSRIGFSLLLAASACQRLGTESSDDGPSPDGDSTAATSDDSDSEPDDESEDTNDPDTGGDGPIELDCDPIAQTGCNSAEKCTVVLQAGEIGYVCVSDEPTIDPLGSCQQALGSGADGCPAGYACLADESESGLCAPLCLDTGDCDSGVCLPDLQNGIPYCAADCSPFEGGCAAPLQCRRIDNSFACSFARADDVGAQGEPCTPQEDAGCAEGFVCLPGGLVPQCASDNCCTLVCDVDTATCESPSSCEPLFDAPAPGSESIGACFVPS